MPDWKKKGAVLKYTLFFPENEGALVVNHSFHCAGLLEQREHFLRRA